MENLHVIVNYVCIYLSIYLPIYLSIYLSTVSIAGARGRAARRRSRQVGLRV